MSTLTAEKKSNIKNPNIKNIIINSILNPAFIIDKEFSIPPIDIQGANKTDLNSIIKTFKKLLPECLEDTSVLPEPIPAFDKYSIHFTREYKINSRHCIYAFRLNLQYGGGGKPFTHSKKPDRFLPGYHTNKIFYHAFLIPAEKVDKNLTNQIVSFKPTAYKEGKKKIITSAEEYIISEIFDEQDFSALNKKLSNLFNPKKDNYKCIADYYPIKFEYATIALNLLYPEKDTIKKILPVFDKMIQIVIDKEPMDILTEDDNKLIKSFYSLYNFDRKVNENRDLYWDISVSDIK